MRGHTIEDHARNRPSVLKLIAQARRKIEEEKKEKIEQERKIREDNLERVAKKKRKQDEIREAKSRQKEAVLQFHRKNLKAQMDLEMDNRMGRESLEQEYDEKIYALKTEKHNRMVKMNQELQEKQEDLARENEEELNKLLSQGDVGNEEERDEVEAAFQPSAPECPVCMESMVPPMRIFQCGTGHLLCASCRPRLQVIHSIFSVATCLDLSGTPTF